MAAVRATGRSRYATSVVFSGPGAGAAAWIRIIRASLTLLVDRRSASVLSSCVFRVWNSPVFRWGHRSPAPRRCPAAAGPARSCARPIELIVSELVTNAVKASTDQDRRPHYTDEHGLACIHLRLSADRQAALVEVWDENFALPESGQPGLDDESGRGLMLIDALAARWGWDLPATGRGKIVWALVES